MDANFVIDNFLPVALGVAAPVAFYVNNGIFVGVPEDIASKSSSDAPRIHSNGASASGMVAFNFSPGTGPGKYFNRINLLASNPVVGNKQALITVSDGGNVDQATYNLVKEGGFTVRQIPWRPNEEIRMSASVTGNTFKFTITTAPPSAAEDE